MRLPILCAAALFMTLGGAALAQDTGPSEDSLPELDYLFFKEKVQPIFLEKRLGHARCVACHTHRAPMLEELAPGAETWTNEQSRRNFEAWRAFVVPGSPDESRMLLHPLARAAGGDAFHAGGKHWTSKADPEWRTLAAWVRGRRLGGLAIDPTAGTEYVIQSNAAGDNLHLIDPESDRIVGLIEGIEAPHGVAAAPDGKRIYVSNEARATLDVVDAKTLEVFKRVPLTGRPNNLAVADDGSKIYVGIRQAPGAVDVVDAETLTRTKSIAVDGPVHNVFLVPDGTHVFAGSIESKLITVIDTTRDIVSWTMRMDAGVRPMAFFKGGDGSTRTIIVQLSDLHGFAALDFGTRRETARVEFPAPDGRDLESGTLQGSPAHGLAVSPDQDVVWSTSKHYGAVYAYAPPGPCRGQAPADGWDKKERCGWQHLKTIEVGAHPDWLALTEDGKKLYVALAGEDRTAVIDTESMEVVAKIPVGNVPKRVVAASLSTR